MSEDSTPITKSEVISPSEDEDNFDNIIEDENVVDIQEDDNEIEEYNTPAYEGSDVDDEIFPKELDEEESFQSNNKDEDKQAKSYATSFREIGDHIFGQYWFPIDTVIPRLTMDSKLMVTFRTSNFNRLKRLITDAKPPTNKLHFIRVTNSDF
ncbi:hypothetical protein GPJ56_005313 [Histomonas meleagridis]|uniref:uncharacterized protein n=1 Tax=Histomonas meleagridis TaxID=135588 RepID=UPI003559A722|nr:hypothetical protein GPJ56_005313 [Histomonas meleagridis]KAH0796293.1 hypothetical protein GO595_010186 [Histomonas meleagridis]